MKNILNILASSTMFLLLSIGVASLPLAIAQAASTSSTKSVACDAIGSGADCNDAANNKGDLSGIVKVILQIISIVAGIAAVIMIIWAGMKYITSGGDSNKMSSAKNTLIYAIIGLIIVALAQFMVQYVLAKTVSGTTPATKTVTPVTKKPKP